MDDRSKMKMPAAPRGWHFPMAPVDFSQTILFLKMTREADETLSSFYHRLRLQANKCSIFCCADRLIRDRLLQAVTNERALIELGRMTDPSIEDILAFENEKHAWHLILPFLSPAEIDSLAKTSPILAKIIDSYLQEGGNITIGADLLQEYPLQANKGLYMRFYGATSLTLRHIKQDHLPELFSCFPCLVHLQMCNMVIAGEVITGEVTCLPRSLTQLTLSEFKMERTVFESWISSMNGTLKSLHLDRLETSFFNEMDVPAPRPIRLQNVCPQLQSLTIKERELQFKFGLRKLRSLKIVTDLLVQNLKLHDCASELETLYVDVRRFDEDADDVGDLVFSPGKISSLTLRNWPSVDEEGDINGALDHLRIIERVDPRHREEVELLDETTTLDVEYLDYATEDQENLLLTALDDVLLLKIMEYLPVGDCIRLSHVDERVHKLVTTQRFRELTIDNDERNNCIYLMDCYPGFFKRIAPSIRRLSVTEFHDVLWILPHCTGLEELQLMDVYLRKKNIPGLPVEDVERVVLLGCSNFWREDMEALMEEYLCKLRNLREVGLDTSYADEVMVGLFESNKDTLEKVSVRIREDDDWEANEDVWTAIGALPHLKELVIDQKFQLGHSEMPDRPQMKRLFSLLGGRLLKLNTDVCGKRFGDVINEELLPKVQDLTLYACRGRLNSEDLAALCSMKELRRLRLEGRHGNIKWVDSDVLTLIQSLPNLVDLIAVGFQSTVRFGVELREYLRGEGRKLKFHSLHF